MPLINPEPDAAEAQPQETPTSSFKSPLLAQVEAKLESHLTPTNRQDYMKIVVAGMKTVTSGGPQGLLRKLTASPNPLQTAVNGPINLIGYMGRSAKGKMPAKAMVPAAMTLMLHALDFLDRTGKLQVTEGVVDQATKMFADGIMKAFNISQAQLQLVAQKAHGVTQDPGQLQQAQQHAAKFKAPYPTQ